MSAESTAWASQQLFKTNMYSSMQNKPPLQSTEQRTKAARVIQAWWRGYLARKAYHRLRQATRKIQAHAKGWYIRKKVSEARDRLAMETKFQAAMARHKERIYMLEKHKRTVQEQPAVDIEVWLLMRNKAAAKVQAAWRGHIQRRRYAQMDPDRAKKEREANEMHKAFRQIISQAQAAHAQDGSAASQQLSAGVINAAGSPLPAALRQSATVLMGSFQKGVGEEGMLLPGAATRDHHMMSNKRYDELRKQVEERVQAHKALARHRRPDSHTINARLKELLNDYRASAVDRLAAAHSRAGQVVALESLAATLDSTGLAPLASLQNPQPHDFPLPPRGSERWERAMQAHASELADARAGPTWWRHLQPLNRTQAQQSLLQEEQERWAELDSRWRRQWARAEAMEARRPDPLVECNIVPPGAPKRSLAEIAEYDLEPNDDTGCVGGPTPVQHVQHRSLAHALLPGACGHDAGLVRDQGKKQATLATSTQLR